MKFLAFGLVAGVSVGLCAQPVVAQAAAPSGLPCLTASPVVALPKAERAQHHASTLVVDAQGRLQAYWFAGSREGAQDVVILRSLWQAGQWSAPQAVLDATRLSELLGRKVRKLGNPVLWRGKDGALQMAVVHVTAGGWAAARVAHLRSGNDGQNFTQAKDWVLSPLWNVSTLVRSPPWPAADGGWLLPVYHEMAVKRAELLKLSETGELISHQRMESGAGVLQPTLVGRDDQPGFLLSLSRTGDAERAPFIHQQQSLDGGRTWSAPQRLSLPNPNAGIALMAWPALRGWLLAYNPETSSRKVLSLAWRSWDDPRGEWRPLNAPGLTWQEPGEASYPAFQWQAGAGGPGEVHLSYTSNRERVLHVRLNGCASQQPEGARQ